MVNKQKQCMTSNHCISFTSLLLLVNNFLYCSYINTLPMLSFQFTISTKTETLEYFTDIEDPISYGFINPRCHTIIKIGINTWMSRIMGYAAMYMLQNCINTLYHNNIYV